MSNMEHKRKAGSVASSFVEVSHDDAREVPIAKWLEPTDYYDDAGEYAKHLSNHATGTGEWLFATSEYREWYESSEGKCLWIKAIPGAGKSVLAAQTQCRLVDGDHSTPVLFFYFRQIIESNRAPIQLVRDWLAQLMPFSSHARQHIATKFVDTKRTLDTASFSELWDVLVQALQERPKTYCIVDALDEMDADDDGDFLLKLNHLALIPGCKVLITSRPTTPIVTFFRDKMPPTITLDSSKLDPDIAVFLDRRISSFGITDRGKQLATILEQSQISTADFKTQLCDTIRQKSAGSFLYAKLAFDAFTDILHARGQLPNLGALREVLDQLPSGLSQMYDELLREHAERCGVSTDFQLFILQWVTHASRPLRVLELASIADFMGVEHSQSGDTKSLIRVACGPLLEILPQDVIGPVHHSFTEYLMSPVQKSGNAGQPVIIEAARTHRTLAEQCLRYLQKPLSEVTDWRTWPAPELRERFPFVDYAYNHWTSHARKCAELDETPIKSMDDFLTSKSEALNKWKLEAMLRDTIYHGGKRRYLQRMGLGDLAEPAFDSITPMHIAAFIGIPSYIERLARQPFDVNARGTGGWTPLHWAAKGRQASSARMLLETGALLGIADEEGLLPLHVAAMLNDASTVKVLCSAGASPLESIIKDDSIPYNRHPFHNLGGELKANSSDGVTAFFVACKRRQRDALEAMIPYLNPTKLGEALSDGFALQMTKDPTGIGQMLVEEPNFPINRIVDYKTPLFVAAASSDFESLRILISRSADASRLSYCNRYGKDSSNGRNSNVKLPNLTPLHGLTRKISRAITTNRRAEYNRLEVIEAIDLLIDAGCPIDAIDAEGRTALSHAQSDMSISLHLIKRGASVDRLLESGQSPLHEIAGMSRPDPTAFSFWRGQGVSIEARDADGRTPFLTCVAKVRNAPGAEALRWILNEGPDLNALDKSGNCCLHLVVQGPCSTQSELLDILISAGVEVNKQNNEGETPAHCISDWGYKSPNERIDYPVNHLIEAGLNLEACDKQGRTVLLNQLAKGVADHVVEHLLQRNCNLHAHDARGASALQIAIEGHCSAKVIQLLSDAGSQLDHEDNSGNSLWHYTMKSLEIFDLTMIKASLGHSNKLGQNALHWAAFINYRLVELCQEESMVDQNVSNHADARGICPIHIAAASSLEAVVALRGRGGDLWRKTNHGQTVFHYAAQARQVEVLEYLSYHAKADQIETLIDSVDTDGWTAIAYAARSGVFAAVEVLLDAGAKVGGPGSLPFTACTLFMYENEKWRQSRALQVIQYTGLCDAATSSLNGEVFEDVARQIGSLSRDIKDWREAYYTLRTQGGDNHNRVWYENKRAEVSVDIRRCTELLLETGAIKGIEELTDGASDERHPLINFGNGQSYSVPMTELQSSNQLLSKRSTPVLGEEDDVVHRFLHGNLSANSSADFLLDIEGKVSTTAESICGMLETSLEVGDRKMSEMIFTKVTSYTFTGNEPCFVRKLVSVLVRKRCHEKLRILGPIIRYCYGTDELTDMWPDILNTQNLNRNGTFEHVFLWPCLPAPSSWRLLYGHEDASEFEYEWSMFAPLHTCLKGPLHGAVIEASNSELSNMKVLQVLVESLNASEQEKVWALFLFAKAERFWHITALEYLAQHSGNLNIQGPNGATALHVACAAGPNSRLSVQAVEILLRYGADPNVLDKRGLTCLSKAAWNASIVQLLLEHGADIELGEARTLMCMIKASNVIGLQILLERHVDVNKCSGNDASFIEPNGGGRRMRQNQLALRKSPRDRTTRNFEHENHCSGEQKQIEQYFPLQYAVAKQLPCCDRQTLHYQKADGKNARYPPENAQGLREQISRNRGRMIKALIDAGADVLTPVEPGIPFMYQLLAQVFDIVPPGEIPTIDLERRDEKGRTALLAYVSRPRNSSKKAFLDDVKQLIRLGADCTVVDDNGCHMIHYVTTKTSYFGEEEFNSILLELFEMKEVKSLLNIRSKKGKLCIIDLIHPCHWSSMKLLIDAGSQVECDLEGNTAFHRCFVRELPCLVKREDREEGKIEDAIERELRYIVSLGFDINAYNKAGDLALFVYLRRAHGAFKTAKPCFMRDLNLILRVTGVDIWKKSINGSNALHVIAAGRSGEASVQRKIEEPSPLLEAWKLFVSLGLDPWEENAEKASALDIAALHENQEILELY